MDLIEKAARAIVRSAYRATPNADPENCADFVERKWRNHADKDLAKRLMEINRRAVIEALREPSEAMINAARSHIDFEERVDIATERIQCRAAWRAMIDALLDEPNIDQTS